MEIIRNDDGTLVVPVPAVRHHDSDDEPDAGQVSAAEEGTAVVTRVLHPGEGGYDEALAEWDIQQNPDRAPAVSTASGRQEAMKVVHDLATSDASAAEVVGALDDAEASGEALRHVLAGGVHAVEDFATETAEAEGGDPLPAHQATKLIGEVLGELD